MLTEILVETWYWTIDFLRQETLLAGSVRAALIMVFLWFFAIMPVLDIKIRKPYTHTECGKTFRRGRKESSLAWQMRFSAHLNACSPPAPKRPVEAQPMAARGWVRGATTFAPFGQP